jgi:hypothetical protein
MFQYNYEIKESAEREGKENLSLFYQLSQMHLEKNLSIKSPVFDVFNSCRLLGRLKYILKNVNIC